MESRLGPVENCRRIEEGEGSCSNNRARDQQPMGDHPGYNRIRTKKEAWVIPSILGTPLIA
jgi:hypothetical protein